MGIQAVGTGGSLNQITPATRTFYDATLIDVLHQWLGLRAFAVEGKDIPQKAGQTISWRQFSKLSAATTALTEGSPPAGSNLTVTEVTATVAQYGDFVEWTDKLLETGPDPYVTETLELQARQIALTFDALIQAVVLAGTNVTYASTATARVEITTAMTFTTAKLDRVIRNLQSRHVPYVTGFIQPSVGFVTVPGVPAYVAFVTPKSWETIKSTTGVNKVDTYQAGNMVFPNEVGKYDAIRFIMSTTGYISAAGGAGGIEVQLMPVMGGRAFAITKIAGLAVQSMIRPIGQPDSSDKLGQKGHVGWKSYFVPKITQQDAIERYEFYAA